MIRTLPYAALALLLCACGDLAFGPQLRTGAAVEIDGPRGNAWALDTTRTRMGGRAVVGDRSGQPADVSGRFHFDDARPAEQALGEPE